MASDELLREYEARGGVSDPLMEAIAGRMGDLADEVEGLDETMSALERDLNKARDENERLQDMLDEAECKNAVTSG